MNWLTNKVLPKINAFVSKKDRPDNLWQKCPECGQMIFHRELVENQSVCPHCDHHLRLKPADRFGLLFDEGGYETLSLPEVPADPLKFRDSKRYPDRLKESRAKTGAADAVHVAVGTIGGQGAVVAAQDFAFMGGSMGAASGEALIAAADAAIGRDAALIAVTASGGMRMQEGILSLMQMPRTTIAVQQVREAGLPFIAVLTDPTTGGVTASFAMLGDIAIAEPGALIGFAGPRVIEQTIRERLPEGFQRAEYLHEHGMLDMVVHRHDLARVLGRVIGLLRQAPEAPEAPEEIEATTRGASGEAALGGEIEIPPSGEP